MKNKYTLHKAIINDISTLVKHHSMMFEEIRTLQGKRKDVSRFEAMEKSYFEKLKAELPSKILSAWVVEEHNNIVASGAISICSLVPIPDDPTFLSAYIHSMYTEKSHRKQGLALQIIEEIKKYCQEEGIIRLFLSASDAGRSVYEPLGFKPLDSFMFYNNKEQENK